MSKKKGIGFGSIVSIIAIIAVVIGIVILNMVMAAGDGLEIASGSQPFYDFTRPEDSAMKSLTMICGIAGAALLLISVILGQIKASAGFKVVVGIIRVLAPVALLVAFLYFVYGSFTGLGWTYFSNEELQIYAEATALGGQVIAGIACYLVASLLAIIAAFCRVGKN